MQLCRVFGVTIPYSRITEVFVGVHGRYRQYAPVFVVFRNKNLLLRSR